MISTFNKLLKKYPYSFRLFFVLVLWEINRILDGFVWMPPQPHKLKIVLLNIIFEFIAFLPIVFLIIYCYRWLIQFKNRLYLILGILIFTLFGPILSLVLNTFLTTLFFKGLSMPITFALIIKYTPIGTTIILLLSATFYITYLILLNRQQVEAVHRAESLTKEVQLKMLRYQINPHFLFNVLNSIHALIDENKAKAKKLVVEMSEYYRYTLNKQQQTIQVCEEIEAVTKYLDIQKMRFEDELYYEIQVEEIVRTFQIPPFIIHLLVENAVKYGNTNAEQRLDILITVKYIDKSLQLIVSNTGCLRTSTLVEKKGNGTGSGIENIKNRLALLYDNNYSFSLKEENGWVVATIIINNIKN